MYTVASLRKYMLSKGKAVESSVWGARRRDSTSLLVGEAFL